MRDPFKQLTSVLEQRMAGHAGKAVTGITSELGTITGAGLKLDRFKHEIHDYLVADWLVTMHLPGFSLIGTATSPVDQEGVPQPGATTTPLTRYDFGARMVDGVRLDFNAGLKPGDRVLAALVNGGQDAVILAKVMSNA